MEGKMSKVFAIHLLTLLPGVDEAAFEKFMSEEFSTLPSLPGMTTTLAKGDRGDRTGQYVFIHEFDSLERRNHYFPSEGGEPAQEFLQAGQGFESVMEKMGQLIEPVDGRNSTDYVVLG
jgi:hypothetical protein